MSQHMTSKFWLAGRLLAVDHNDVTDWQGDSPSGAGDAPLG